MDALPSGFEHSGAVTIINYQQFLEVMYFVDLVNHVKGTHWDQVQHYVVGIIFTIGALYT